MRILLKILFTIPVLFAVLFATLQFLTSLHGYGMLFPFSITKEKLPFLYFFLGLTAFASLTTRTLFNGAKLSKSKAIALITLIILFQLGTTAFLLQQSRQEIKQAMFFMVERTPENKTNSANSAPLR